MKLDYSKLDGRITELFRNRKNFSKAIELSEHSLSCKMNGKVQWKQSEIINACYVLRIPKSLIHEYFFCEKRSTH